jgi:hypothetical protein
MGIDSHLSTCVCTQSPKYLEMAQGHISLSVCPELQNLGNDERPFLGRSKFVVPSGVLSQPKYQVSHLEASGPNPSSVVASQRLLVPR